MMQNQLLHKHSKLILIRNLHRRNEYQLFGWAKFLLNLIKWRNKFDISNCEELFSFGYSTIKINYRIRNKFQFCNVYSLLMNCIKDSVRVMISFLTNTKLYDNLSKSLTKLAKACWKLAPKLEISTNISWHASFLQLACKLSQMGKLPC